MGQGFTSFYFEVALAEFIKHLNQVLANHLRVSPFDMVPFHKVYQLSILEQCNGWR